MTTLKEAEKLAAKTGFVACEILVNSRTFVKGRVQGLPPKDAVAAEERNFVRILSQEEVDKGGKKREDAEGNVVAGGSMGGDEAAALGITGVGNTADLQTQSVIKNWKQATIEHATPGASAYGLDDKSAQVRKDAAKKMFPSVDVPNKEAADYLLSLLPDVAPQGAA